MTSQTNNMTATQAIKTRRSVKHFDPAHRMTDLLSFMLAIGKQAKPVWPRGERLPDSEVVIHDRF